MARKGDIGAPGPHPGRASIGRRDFWGGAVRRRYSPKNRHPAMGVGSLHAPWGAGLKDWPLQPSLEQGRV